MQDNNEPIWPSFSEYIKFCNQLKIKTNMSASDWIELGASGIIQDKHYHGLGFIPSMPRPTTNPGSQFPGASPLNPFRKPSFITPGGIDITGGISGLLGPDNIVTVISGLYDDLSDPTKSDPEKVKTVVKTILDQISKNNEEKGDDIKIESDSIQKPRKPSVTSFSVKEPAVEVSYSPEIPNTLYSDYYRTCSDKDANLYISSLLWDMPAEDPQVINYVERILVPDLQTRANVSVNFNVNAEQTFTFSRVCTYMTTIMHAMRTYYSYANIIAYQSHTSNSNTGMYELRNMIDAEDINLIGLLGERLNNLPIPPRLRELAFWLSNIYKSNGDCPNSPVLMIVPFSFGYTTTSDVDGDGLGYSTSIESSVQQIIQDLNPGVNNPLGADYFNDRFINMLAKVCPGWLNTPMGSATGIPFHDPHWMDVWSNSPALFVTPQNDTKLYEVPFLDDASDRGEEIKYVTHSTTISGINQALFSVKMSSTWSGMLKPKENIAFKKDGNGNVYFGQTNRFFFGSGPNIPNGALYMYGGDALDNFANNPKSFVNSQSGWFNTPGTLPVSTMLQYNEMYMPVDCQPANGMNLSSNANPAYQSTRWLMSFDEAFTGPKKPKTFRKARGKKDKLTTDE